MRGHVCPLCGVAGVPVYWAACPRCFRPMPFDLARRLTRAWKGRVLHPAAYQELLAEVLLWQRDHHVKRRTE